jgi:thioredoxin-like negative regulator of GroEL
MENILSLQDFENKINEKDFVLFYLSKPECSVCVSLLPKVKEVVEAVPGLEGYYVNLGENQEIAGQLRLFSIPVVLVYAGGRETIKEVRNFSIPELQKKLLRISELMS